MQYLHLFLYLFSCLFLLSLIFHPPLADPSVAAAIAANPTVAAALLGSDPAVAAAAAALLNSTAGTDEPIDSLAKRLRVSAAADVLQSCQSAAAAAAAPPLPPPPHQRSISPHVREYARVCEDEVLPTMHMTVRFSVLNALLEVQSGTQDALSVHKQLLMYAGLALGAQACGQAPHASEFAARARQVSRQSACYYH